MLFADFLLRADLIAEFKAEEKKDQLVAAAYTAWLMGSAGGKKSFKSYLVGLGLMDKPEPLTREEKREMARRSYSTAARIIDLDRKRRERG